jgi:hypothetical protein
VTRGLANRKFSGSVKRLGVNKINNIKSDNAIEYPNASLIE